MKLDHPVQAQIPALRHLWKEAFGDTDDFLDLFFSTAFAPARCRCITEGGKALAALYWFDVTCREQRFAYIYAVATAKSARGRGLCRMLMSDTAEVLKEAGYAGILLVPQEEGLIGMYAKMGYLPATDIGETICAAIPGNIRLAEISAREYAALRPTLLPSQAVLQEGVNMDFLARIARFYATEGLLAAISQETEHLRILEFLGPAEYAGQLVFALGRTEATLRYPGKDRPFAMYLPLADSCQKPEYFAFCFD